MNNVTYIQAFQWLGPSSEYILVGLSQCNDNLPINGRQIIQKNIKLSGVNEYTDIDLKKAVDFITENSRKYPWHKLTGPNFELEEWKSAIEAVRQNTYYRVLFRPEKEIPTRKTSSIEGDNELALCDLETPELNDDPKKSKADTNEFRKIPKEMHQALEEIIRDALPHDTLDSK